MAVSIFHETPEKKGHASESRLVIDERGILTVEARDTATGKAIKNSCELKNLS
jgi:molecular chaperone DnaK (HSP70)